jgi:hypothetical protein
MIGVIDLAATRASQIATEQRFEHQDERITLHAHDMLLDDISADLRDVAERYGHGRFLL